MESHLMIKLTALTSEEEPHSTLAAFLVDPSLDAPSPTRAIRASITSVGPKW